MLEHIRDDYLAAQVSLELGRDTAHQYSGSPELHRIPVTDILHHTRLGDAQHLAACLDRIAQAFQEVRRDPSATRFAFDRMGGLYVHDTTRQSIKALWQALVTSRLTPASAFPGMPYRPGPRCRSTRDPMSGGNPSGLRVRVCDERSCDLISVIAIASVPQLIAGWPG